MAADAGAPAAGRAPRKRIGPYVLGETLGEGGFSKVKLGVHEATGDRVALKIMKRSRVGAKSSTQLQVEREIASMGAVKHRNVLRLHEVLWDATYTKKSGRGVPVVVVVLELAQGGELFELLSFTGAFEESVARSYFRQLIDGVTACHALGVAHRDLKPENLLLDDAFRLKIADFGFAGAFGGMNDVLYTECGTPGYMAPEVKQAGGYDPKAADLWACGVILFVMLAGFPPFQRPTLDDWWFNKLHTGRHDLFWMAHSRTAYFSEQARDFINRLLCPDPRRRMTAEAVRRHPWYAGDSIPDTELAAEMARRKHAVDLKRARGGAVEPNSSFTESDGGGAGAGASGDGSESLDSETMRSAGGSSPLPRGQPMRMRSLGAQFEADGGFDSDGDSGERPPPPVYGAEGAGDGVRHYTTMAARDRPAAVLRMLVAVLEGLGARHTVDRDGYSVKADVMAASGAPVRVQVRVFADPDSDGVSVCEVRRRKGDTMLFHQVFVDLRSRLAAAVPVDGDAVRVGA